MITAEHLRKTFPGKGKDKQRVIAVDDVGFTAACCRMRAASTSA